MDHKQTADMKQYSTINPKLNSKLLSFSLASTLEKIDETISRESSSSSKSSLLTMKVVAESINSSRNNFMLQKHRNERKQDLSNLVPT